MLIHENSDFIKNKMLHWKLFYVIILLSCCNQTDPSQNAE